MKIKNLMDERGLVAYQAPDNYPLLSIDGALSASTYVGLPIFELSGGFSGSYFQVNGTISASNYEGIHVGTESVGNTNIAAYNQTGSWHEPTITSTIFSSPGQAPNLVLVGTTVGLQFTVDNTNNRSYRTMKVPASYVTNSLAYHIHWTKSSDLNNAGRYVRWHVAYTTFDGRTQNINTGSTSSYIEDTYDDSGTTTRIVYRTQDMPISGALPGGYLSLQIDAETPTSGTGLTSSPILISLDVTYNQYINK